MVNFGNVKVAIGAIVGVIVVTAVANYFGAGIEAALVTGAITAIAALASPATDDSTQE